MIDVAVIVGNCFYGQPLIGIFCGEEIVDGVNEFKNNSQIETIQYCFGGKAQAEFFWNKSPEELSKLTPGHKLYEVSLLLVDANKNTIVKWVPVVNTARIIAANINLYTVTKNNDISSSCITVMASAKDGCEAIKIAKIYRNFIVCENTLDKRPSRDYAKILNLKEEQILF